MLSSQLQLFGLPLITNGKDFAELLGIREETLVRLAYGAEHYYKEVLIPKKSGGMRQLCVPNRQLKAVQSWILQNILYKLHSNVASKGFERGSSIKDNVIPHIGATHIVKVDLKDFFTTIKSKNIFLTFKTIGYNNQISKLLTLLCSYKSYLPQGSPASPKLANLICHRLDARISRYVEKSDITYTRYADDITLSAYSPQKICAAYKFIQKVISEENFILNIKKTRFVGPTRRKKITGLVISEKKSGIGRIEYRNMRKILHELFLKSRSDYSFFHGKMNWINDVDIENFKRLKKLATTLSKKTDDERFKKEMKKYE